MVGIAQLVRAPGCGPGGRGFESLYSPHFLFKDTILGCRQAVRHETLTLALVGSNPATPAMKKVSFAYQKRLFSIQADGRRLGMSSASKRRYVITAKPCMASRASVYVLPRRLDHIQYFVLITYRLRGLHAFFSK